MTLTEQWKKGELSEGYYYFKMPDGAIEIASEYKLIRYKLTKDADKIEVIAPVPNYEKWQELSNQRNQLIRDVKDLAYIQEENAKLKELLKECKCEFEEITKFCNKEIEYAHKQTNNFCIPAEGLAIILHSTDNKELLTKIDNAIGEKK